MKNIFLGQAFMIPSYALIGAGIANKEDMTAFMVLHGLAFVAALIGLYTGYLWVNWRYPRPSV